MRKAQLARYLTEWLTWGLGIALLICIPAVAFGQESGCFDSLHAKVEPKDADYFFDLKYDRNAAGQSFSCGPVMRASEARRALESFRYGFLYDSETHIKESVDFPLTIRVYQTRTVEDKGESYEIHDTKEWFEFRKTHFDKLQTALISCANIRNVAVHWGRGGYGFTIGSGSVWF